MAFASKKDHTVIWFSRSRCSILLACALFGHQAQPQFITTTSIKFNEIENIASKDYELEGVPAQIFLSLSLENHKQQIPNTAVFQSPKPSAAFRVSITGNSHTHLGSLMSPEVAR